MATTTAATAGTSGSSTNGTIYIDTQHEDLVHDSQMDFYGAKLATCSSDRTIKVYNVSDTSYEIVATIQGHFGPVWQISWAHPKFGTILGSCSFDGSIMIHKEQQMGVWNTIYNAQGIHNSSVNGIVFAPHEYYTSLMLATASSDGRVAIVKHIPNNQTWSIEYIQDCSTGVNAVTWAPYGSYYNMTVPTTTTATNNGVDEQQQPLQMEPQLPRIATAGCDNCVRFYVGNVVGEQWTLEYTTPSSSSSSLISNSSGGVVVGHTDWVRDVAWAPCLLPNYNTVASCSEDRTVIIWTQDLTVNDENINNNDSDGTTKSGEWVGTIMHTFDEPVWRVSWSITGHLLAVSCGDSNVTLWKASLHDRKKFIQVPTVSSDSNDGSE